MTISEAWQNVKAAAAEVYAKYSVTHPHWHHEDSPLKYVDPNRVLEATFAKTAVLADHLVFSRRCFTRRVFEAGPGAGYLAYLLRTCYGVDVSGCDVADRPLYKDLHQLLDIHNVVDAPVVRGETVAALAGRYDYIIATQIAFMDGWTTADLGVFLASCREHLNEYGRIVLFPNPRALPAFEGCGGQEIELPFLGRGYVFSATP